MGSGRYRLGVQEKIGRMLRFGRLFGLLFGVRTERKEEMPQMRRE